MIDDSSTRSVSRSVASVTHGEAHYYFAVAACLNVSRLGLSIITQQRGASPVLALPCASGSLTEESTGWTFSRDCMHHLTVSTAGGEPAGVVAFVVVFPTPLGFPPPNVEPILL